MSKEKEITNSKLLLVVNKLLDIISSREFYERTSAEILEANVSNVLTHEEQMNLLDELTNIDKGGTNV